ncbi:MAG: relaxase/mobilization nuclease domain-containing protein [Urechidicola sp.]|nr:relaxase/mobilization nuclease domain-containing protein [Urechidicola sp.]
MNRFISGDRKYHKELIASKGDVELETSVLEARIANMNTQYIANNKKRLVPHSKANVAYHEIISFHASDSKNLLKEDLQKLARVYAKERSPNSLVVASMHRNKEHLHIHIIVSAVELDGKVKRLSKNQFREVKQTLERYQDKHLKLEHSKVNHSKKKNRPY